MLTKEDCHTRQARLLALLTDRKLDAIVLGLPYHVYYASAHRPHWQQSAAFILLANGRSLLITADSPDVSAFADEVFSFQASCMGTNRQEQPEVLGAQINALLRQHHATRIGIDTSPATANLMFGFGGAMQPIDADIWQIRRSKLPDELTLMRHAAQSAQAMYARAKEMIEPGLTEIDLYNQLHAAAVKATGEPMSGLLGNDFACGTGGGPPRNNHRAQPGQLWILDLGPSYRGYFSDSARVFSVDRNPTDAQLKAWHAIAAVFPMIENTVKPGVRCRDVFMAIDEYLFESAGQRLSHHLGHGVGLQPHEYPHLNPKWDDVFIEGDVFTVEPGVYSPELNAGIRLENEYVVTASGVENLIHFPLELT